MAKLPQVSKEPLPYLGSAVKIEVLDLVRLQSYSTSTSIILRTSVMQIAKSRYEF